MSSPLVDRAADAFAATLLEWRAKRGLSKKQLAAVMGFDPSYVSHVEARRHRPTEDFARRQPMVFFLGAAAAGFLAARFLKAGMASSDGQLDPDVPADEGAESAFSEASPLAPM